MKTVEDLLNDMKAALAMSPLVTANTERMQAEAGTPTDAPSTPTNTIPTPVTPEAPKP